MNPVNTSASAQAVSYTLLEPLGTVKSYVVESSGLATYLGDASKYLFMLIAVISAFYLIYGGIQYLTTDMSSLKLEGKETIKRVIVGLIFIFSIWTVFNAINPDMLRVVDFGGRLTAGAPSVTQSPGRVAGTQVPPTAAPSGTFPWPTGRVTGNGVTCNGGVITKSINTNACVDQYRVAVQQASQKHGVPINLIRAVIWQESDAIPSKVSPAGAVGLMQILPSTANAIGCQSGWQTDPALNIDCGTRYLRQGLSRGYTNYDLYAGYNGGYGGNSMNPSTSCSSQNLKRWQCSFDNNEHTTCNEGFNESRNYAVMGATWESRFSSGMCSW